MDYIVGGTPLLIQDGIKIEDFTPKNDPTFLPYAMLELPARILDDVAAFPRGRWQTASFKPRDDDG